MAVCVSSKTKIVTHVFGWHEWSLLTLSFVLSHNSLRDRIHFDTLLPFVSARNFSLSEFQIAE